MSHPSASRRRLVAWLAAIPLLTFTRARRLSATTSPLASVLEPQPHMKAALASLKLAQGHLLKATPDKGGHRAKAMVLVDDAIKETQAGIDFDNTH